ncbi:MAG TPA: geranylgeranylglyceryl/heptaprenylglyceryl phosphate synthase [Flavobacterium sp.]|nr:geranylgeranylglyceryl/heptaprenylglyceryl phosphate synthase [Flavobacterium sp.]
MGQLYNDILLAKASGQKLLAILLDPDKIVWNQLDELVKQIYDSPATHIFVGGSLVLTNRIGELISAIKQSCPLPIILFPGNPSQISDKADGILFLSLISGRNSDFLIGHHINAAPLLKKTTLEIIPTGYILINGGSETAVLQVSQTQPIDRDNPELAVATALAGEMLGNKLIYLEAGSGAKLPVPTVIIKNVAENINIPLIVGGGITSSAGIQSAYEHGADMVVIGTAFENNIHFFNDQP